MKKLVALFVLLLLPLQVAFAAGAEYCEIEAADSGQHFGHHSHPDQGKQKQGDPAGDPDCAFCHLGCTSAQVSEFALAIAPAMALSHLPDARRLPGVSPPPLDRPPRAVLA